ncbi:MAG: hypothetical protein INH41_25745 [Myxococcaceae bacterium]|jgi:hypothetical protein|nr:hypothetical protein [Myxococcaceae bacterium]
MKRLSLFLSAALLACGPRGAGTFQVTVSGGERAERGFAPSLLRDRWGLTFTRYLVSVGDLEASRDGARLERPGVHVVDVQKGTRDLFPWSDVPAGRWDIAFSLRPPPPEATSHGVADEDVREMRANGWAYLVEGVATRTGVGTTRFRVGLPLNHRYTRCTNGLDGTLGLVVGDGATETLELTMHVDHMLYDRLGTHRGVNLRFDAWTSRATPEGLVTLAALERQDLLDLRATDGGPLLDIDGARVVYDPGSFDVRTLDRFVAQSLKDQAHLNGGGLCTVSPLGEGS